MRYRIILIVLLLLLLTSQELQAQCAMCKMAAENGARADGSPILGLNQGILYLAAVPYLSFMVIAYLVWRGYKRRQREEAELQAP